MDMPLYEYDQVITCKELSTVTDVLIDAYMSIPRWKFITRMKYRVMINTVTEIHQALHLKSDLYSQRLKGEVK